MAPDPETLPCAGRLADLVSIYPSPGGTGGAGSVSVPAAAGDADHVARAAEGKDLV
eukprot:CAMPEP_0179219920 /NCGR_PEP_ID=MMETSP0797-20121207/5305_1 /TAXON_ID=47934 /ORGANISM="Dinophysis acuminata, Strain DAEP01" /LENGTH=55 /DNA_ID=CAMNT_0020926449 /DNA_START=24 /DNA_END=187 /DNA_ORIENTATION=+